MTPMEALAKIHSEAHLTRRLLQALVRIHAAEDERSRFAARIEARRLFGEGGDVVPLRKGGA